MKIARVEVYRADLPYAGGTYTLSGGRTYTGFDATFTRVVAEDGTEGWGESTPFGATYIAAHGRGVRAGLAEVAPAVIGLDPRCLDRVNDAMDEALVGHLHAKTPIDVASWDLFGKAAGMPVCDLLGGRIPGPVPMISSIYAGDPEEMRARVAAHRAKGFGGHSVKVGASEAEGGPMLDAERIRACLADRRPGEWFLVDANGGLSPEHALRMLGLLPAGLDFVLEAPCATWRETLSLRGFGGDELIEDSLMALNFGPDGVVLFILAIAFLLGFVLDWIEITLIMLPLLAPVLSTMDVDLVWFAIFFAVTLQTSFITPPVGFALFYMKGVAPASIDTPTIYRGIIPFAIIQVTVVTIIFFFPKLATWLPTVAYG